MSGIRRIRVSSRALGHRLRVEVLVYDDLGAMRRAADRFSGGDPSDALGVTQALLSAQVDSEGNRGPWRLSRPIIRLWRERLGAQVVSHEMHHAATALYGAHLSEDAVLEDVLTHYNEEFAHLYSDLFMRLVKALYRHGYYEGGG